MKTITIFIAIVLAASSLFAQDVKSNLEEIKVTPPRFTGIVQTVEISEEDDFVSFEKYLINNLKYPQEVISNGAEGTELVRFEVTANGKLSSFEVLNSVAPEIDEAIHDILLTTCGMWKAGETNGEPRSMTKEVAIEFKWKQFESLNQTKDFDELAKHYMTKGTEQLLLKNNPQKALKFFNHGINYRPNEDCLLMGRGLCKYEMGDKKGAMADWARMQSSGTSDEAVAILNDYKNLKGYAYLETLLQSK
ncbi:TonB family protein [Draconibacterium orientale]|uniref:TonB family protein n=1 Tax=Draconibacterium orientale TaxID=1168034 RepID=UPI002ABDF403|nr:TonB family protein [Draconibacterium orientale]